MLGMLPPAGPRLQWRQTAVLHPKKKQKAGLSSEISQSAANFESEDENVELDEQGNEESSRRGNRILIHYFLKLKTFFFISCGGEKKIIKIRN